MFDKAACLIPVTGFDGENKLEFDVPACEKPFRGWAWGWATTTGKIQAVLFPSYTRIYYLHHHQDRETTQVGSSLAYLLLGPLETSYFLGQGGETQGFCCQPPSAVTQTWTVKHRSSDQEPWATAELLRCLRPHQHGATVTQGGWRCSGIYFKPSFCSFAGSPWGGGAQDGGKVQTETQLFIRRNQLC